MRELFAAAEEPKSLWLVDGASHDRIRNPVLDILSKDVIAFLNAAWQKPQVLAAAMPRFQ